MDYLPSSKATTWGRYSDARSELNQRGGGVRQTNYSSLFDIEHRTQSLTLGSSQTLAPQVTNEVRFNYSRSRAHAFATLDNFGGAVGPPASVLFPSFASSQDAIVNFYGDLNPNGLRLLDGKFGNNLVQQFNVTDNLSLIIGAHQIKAGVDYRRINPDAGLYPYDVQYNFGSHNLRRRSVRLYIATRDLYYRVLT